MNSRERRLALLFGPTDYKRREMEEENLLIAGIVEGNPGVVFPAWGLAEKLDIPAYRCIAILRKLPTVHLSGQRFMSVAKPLVPTRDGLSEEEELERRRRDELGRQAREDFEANKRRGRKRVPVLQKF